MLTIAQALQMTALDKATVVAGRHGGLDSAAHRERGANQGSGGHFRASVAGDE